jgi:DNA-binding transcriptional LysR family regulator
VELTASGEAVFAHARRLRLSVEDISREVADLSHGRSGHLRIGAAPVFALYLVPTACDALLKEAPKVTFKITLSGQDSMLAALHGGELDLAISTMQVPRYNDLVGERLYDEDYVLFAGAHHRLAKRKQLTMADLVGERWAMSSINNPTWRRLSQMFADAGLPPLVIGVETTDLPLRHHLIAASDMISFGSRDVARHVARRFPIVELRVKDLAYTRRVGVFCRKESYLSPAARRFIEILKATAKEIADENR